jgi:hypothetical protein
MKGGAFGAAPLAPPSIVERTAPILFLIRADAPRSPRAKALRTILA